MIGRIGVGPWEVLTAEMKRHGYQIGPTGQISYAAPGGYHDDCVMALALARWASVEQIDFDILRFRIRQSWFPGAARVSQSMAVG